MRNVIWEPFGQDETKQDWALWERDLRVTGQLYQLQLFLIHVGDNKVCLKSPGPQAEELQLLSAWKASSKTCLPLLVKVLYHRHESYYTASAALSTGVLTAISNHANPNLKLNKMVNSAVSCCC